MSTRGVPCASSVLPLLVTWSKIEKVKRLIESLRNQTIETCRGKIWWIRVPLLLWFVYILVNHLRDPMYQSVFKFLNLGIHELGHILFRPLGMFLEITGGSLLQCLVPIGSIPMFYRQRDFFAIAFSFGWLSTNLFDIATYVGDARQMSLPLVNPFGGEVIHDWHYLLSRMGMLPYATKIAFLIRCGAILFMLICLGGGTWLLGYMFKSR